MFYQKLLKFIQNSKINVKQNIINLPSHVIDILTPLHPPTIF